MSFSMAPTMADDELDLELGMAAQGNMPAQHEAYGEIDSNASRPSVEQGHGDTPGSSEGRQFIIPPVYQAHDEYGVPPVFYQRPAGYQHNGGATLAQQHTSHRGSLQYINDPNHQVHEPYGFPGVSYSSSAVHTGATPPEMNSSYGRQFQLGGMSGPAVPYQGNNGMNSPAFDPYRNTFGQLSIGSSPVERYPDPELHELSPKSSSVAKEADAPRHYKLKKRKFAEGTRKQNGKVFKTCSTCRREKLNCRRTKIDGQACYNCKRSKKFCNLVVAPHPQPGLDEPLEDSHENSKLPGSFAGFQTYQEQTGDGAGAYTSPY